jgi:hypothetical protein
LLAAIRRTSSRVSNLAVDRPARCCSPSRRRWLWRKLVIGHLLLGVPRSFVGCCVLHYAPEGLNCEIELLLPGRFITTADQVIE